MKRQKLKRYKISNVLSICYTQPNAFVIIDDKNKKIYCDRKQHKSTITAFALIELGVDEE